MNLKSTVLKAEEAAPWLRALGAFVRDWPGFPALKAASNHPHDQFQGIQHALHRASGMHVTHTHTYSSEALTHIKKNLKKKLKHLLSQKSQVKNVEKQFMYISIIIFI